MIDDWGWYNNGYHGNELIKTPFIDKLVSDEALQIERHYAFKFCSPTRRSFLSGRLPPHNGENNGVDATVDLRQSTIADKMKAAGYVTGYSGKWHAGHATVAQTPKGRGFDRSLGYFNGACDHWTQEDREDTCGQALQTSTTDKKPAVTDLWDTDKPAWGMNGTYGDYMYVGRCVETIEAHDTSKPLFYYLAMQCAHDPMQAPDRFLDLYDKDTTPSQKEYAFSSVIDEGLANVTEALKSKGMWDNTLLVVSSDNGGPAFSDQGSASNYPMRGGKYTLFEGGIRVNAFVTGGLLPAAMRGKSTSAAMHIADWYTTFSGLAGVDFADDHDDVPSVDGVDQWPVISGQTTAPQRTEIFVAKHTLIQDKWKLIATNAGDSRWSGPLYPQVPAEGEKDAQKCSAEKPCLFNIITDASERTEVADKHPDVVKRMQARLDELMEGIWSPTRPNVTKEAKCAATAKNGGYLTPADWFDTQLLV
jgi:arylsulfatase I/J